jgi:hypothetical protein
LTVPGASTNPSELRPEISVLAAGATRDAAVIAEIECEPEVAEACANEIAAPRLRRCPTSRHTGRR